MMDEHQNDIEINPAKMLVKPVVRGTRITVAMIVGELKAGYTVDDVLKAHPIWRKRQ